MQTAFDITGDLDTPVSAFMKLGAFAPRFLLESVEGGERLARYSFIGFGDGLEVRLDETGLTLGAERRPLPADGAALLEGLRAALAAAPQPKPDIAASSATPPMTWCATSSGCHSGRRPPPMCRRCTTSRRARCWCSIT